jgi:hypothetical protein
VDSKWSIFPVQLSALDYLTPFNHLFNKVSFDPPFDYLGGYLFILLAVWL